jgi:hypothetical protein
MLSVTIGVRVGAEAKRMFCLLPLLVRRMGLTTTLFALTFRQDPRLALYGAVRGHHDQGLVMAAPTLSPADATACPP